MNWWRKVFGPPARSCPPPLSADEAAAWGQCIVALDVDFATFSLSGISGASLPSDLSRFGRPAVFRDLYLCYPEFGLEFLLGVSGNIAYITIHIREAVGSVLGPAYLSPTQRIDPFPGTFRHLEPPM